MSSVYTVQNIEENLTIVKGWRQNYKQDLLNRTKSEKNKKRAWAIRYAQTTG